MTKQKDHRRVTGTGDDAAAREAGTRIVGAAVEKEEGPRSGGCEAAKRNKEMVCPSGYEALTLEDKRGLTTAAFFAAKRADVAARGYRGMADGYGEDLAWLEVVGLLNQAEGRARS